MRKLATAAFAFSAAVFAANYILPVGALPLLALGCALAALGLLCLKRYWLRLFVLTLLGLSLGFGCFYVHARRTLLPARQWDGATCRVTAEVLDYPKQYNDYCSAQVRIIQGAPPHAEAIVYDDTGSLSRTEPGQIVSVTLRLTAADTRYGRRYDAYNARDVYFTGSLKAPAELLESGRDLRLLPARLNHGIGELITQLFPGDVCAFMRSLLLGDKSELYDDDALYLAMSRAGFMHVAAVSGMHVSFLIGLLQLLFGKSRRSSLLCMGLVWCFVLVVGASPSAVRAGIMQSFLLLAPLVGRENDPPTSLAAALGLILLFNPSAAASVSLQLSFGAMAGILCFAAPLQRAMTEALPEGRLRDWLRAPIATAATSLAVLVFTVPLTAVHFGSVPVLSPLTNLLGLWAVSICFCGGFLSCAAGALLPAAGRLLAWVTAWPARYLTAVAALVSRIPFAAVYLRHTVTALWLVLCYLIVLVALFSRLPKAVRLLVPLGLCAASLALTLGVTRWNYRTPRGVITVIDVGQGQCISVMAGDKTALIDCGGIWTLDNAGDAAGSYLRACGRERVDLLMLTHLHADHANGVVRLMAMLPVDTIVLADGLEDSDGMLEGILNAAERQGTKVVFLQRDAEMRLGGIAFSFFAPGDTGGMNERCLTARVSLDDYDMLVTGDIPKSAEKQLVERYALEGTELYIVGHHGSKYASAGELLAELGGDTAVISVGYNNFGHPTEATLQRLDAYGYRIYRTDESGTIEIWIG